VPLLIWSKSMQNGVDLGDRKSFADVAATLAAYFSVPGVAAGESLATLLGWQPGSAFELFGGKIADTITTG
jgi:phosphopentomutase